MSGLPQPAPLFNPLTASTPPTALDLLASPLGLIAYLPLVPLVRIAGRRWPRAALCLSSLLWIFATAGPLSTLILVGGLLVGATWVGGLGRLAARGALPAALMRWLVWTGLAILIFPLWWNATQPWYGWAPTPLPPLHNLGFAYIYLRLVAWGMDYSRAPHEPLRPADTLTWLLYVPCMRLGPVMRRQQFLELLTAWNPREKTAWRDVGQRFGFLVIGAAALAVLNNNTPHVYPDRPDFFAAPQLYPTDQLVRVFYNTPLTVYLLLWCYNEIAAGLSRWIGIPVANNFDWLPAATSVRDFWRRWHVTLGAWLREYIYIPLGGNRGNVPLHYAAVFGFGALWHGAAWSFVAWAATQTAALSLQRLWDRWAGRPRGWLWTGVCWLLTMHYQLATLVIFVDFEHCGLRFLPELARRAGMW